jgi:hypothetical protein
MSAELDLARMRDWAQSVDPASQSLDDRRALQVGLALDLLEAERKRADAAEAVIAKVRALHEPFSVYAECGHDHEPGDPGVEDVVEECGYTCAKLYDICRLCCAEGDDYQTESCISNHDHGPGKPICTTIAALNGTEEQKHG